MNTPPVVEVEWFDAHVEGGEAHTQPLYKPALRMTTGYIAHESKSAIGIAQTVDWEDEDGEMSYQDILWVPRGMIHKKRVVRR